MVFEVAMKNITLSADERLIEAARREAQHRRTTLNAEFRRWLEQYASGSDSGEQRVRNYRILMSELASVSTGGVGFSRDELNER
jgi:cell division protein FtsL